MPAYFKRRCPVCHHIVQLKIGKLAIGKHDRYRAGYYEPCPGTNEKVEAEDTHGTTGYSETTRTYTATKVVMDRTPEEWQALVSEAKRVEGRQYLYRQTFSPET